MTQFESFSGQLAETITLLQEQLDELSLKQQDLHKVITDSRNGSLTEEEYADVKVMMDKTSAYNSKLLSLRTTMVNMSLKSKQLRKRSDKLKATKLDYLSKVESIRKLEQERDMSIAAKVSDSTTGGVVLEDQQRLNRSSQSPSPSSSSPTHSVVVSSPKLLDKNPLLPATAVTTTMMVSENKSTTTTAPVATAVPLQFASAQRTSAAAAAAAAAANILSSSPTTPSTSTPSSPLSPSESPLSSGTIAMAKKKKKKKSKAREVEIGDDDDGPAWIPKRTLSTAATQPKRP